MKKKKSTKERLVSPMEAEQCIDWHRFTMKFKGMTDPEIKLFQKISEAVIAIPTTHIKKFDALSEIFQATLDAITYKTIGWPTKSRK